MPCHITSEHLNWNRVKLSTLGWHNNNTFQMGLNVHYALVALSLDPLGRHTGDAVRRNKIRNIFVESFRNVSRWRQVQGSAQTSPNQDRQIFLSRTGSTAFFSTCITSCYPSLYVQDHSDLWTACKVEPLPGEGELLSLSCAFRLLIKLIFV